MNSVTVVVPTPLRKFTAGESELEVAGATLRDVLDEMEARHPGVRERLMDGDEVRCFLTVFIDSEDARHHGGLGAEVAAGATVTISMALAGG